MMDHLFDSEAHNYIVVFHSDESEKRAPAFVGFVLDFRLFRSASSSEVFFGIVNNNKTPTDRERGNERRKAANDFYIASASGNSHKRFSSSLRSPRLERGFNE
jgi:hypothetical protein